MSGNVGALRERSASDMNVVGKKPGAHKTKPLSGAAATASVRFSQNIENYDMTQAYNLPITPYTKGESPEEIKAKRTFLAGSTPHNNKDNVVEELSQSTQKLLQGYNNHDYAFNYPGLDANNQIFPMPVNVVSFKSNVVDEIDESNIPSPKLIVQKDLFGDKSMVATPSVDNLNHSSSISSDNSVISAPKPSPRPTRATPLNDSPFSLASHTSYTKSDNLDASNSHCISQHKLLSSLFSSSPHSPMDSRLDISELTVNCSTQVANNENQGNNTNNFERKTKDDANPYMNQLGLSASSTASSPAVSSSYAALSLTHTREDLNQSSHSPGEKQSIISDFSSTPYNVKASSDYASVRPVSKARLITEASTSNQPNSFYHTAGPVPNVAYNYHSTNTTSVPRAHYVRTIAEKNLEIGVSFSNPPALGRLRGRDTKITSVCTNSHTNTAVSINNIVKETKTEVSTTVPEETPFEAASIVVRDVAIGPSTADISIQCNENSILVSKNPCHDDTEFQVSPDSSFNSNDNWPSYRSQANEVDEERGLDELLSPPSEIFIAVVKADTKLSTNSLKAAVGTDKEKDRFANKSKSKQVITAAKLAQPKVVNTIAQHQSTIGKSKPTKSGTAAKRILKTAPVESSIDSPSSVDTSSNEKQIRFYDSNFDDSNFVTSTLNETSAIDSTSNHAIANADSPNTFDIEDKSIFSEVNTSMNNITFATTISIEDDSMTNDISIGSDGFERINKYSAPKLVVGQRKVVKDSAFSGKSNDIKEITIVCDTGSSSTLMLTFGNQKDRKLSMFPKAIQMRYDPTQPGDEHSHPRALNSFQVSPQSLDIAPHGEKTMYLSFSPPSGYAGIYSGALKIISGKKSFVLLLRGEATDASPVKDCSRSTKVQPRSSDGSNYLDSNMPFLYPETSYNRNEVKSVGCNEYQRQVACASNEFQSYNSNSNDHQVATDYCKFDDSWMPSKPNAHSIKHSNNSYHNSDNAISAYQGIKPFNNFSYNGNIRQYESIGSVDGMPYNRSNNAYSYYDNAYPDFSERDNPEQYGQRYLTRNVDDIPVSPPFFLAKSGIGAAPAREEYPIQTDFNMVDSRTKVYDFDPYSVNYDYPQYNECRHTVANNTVSPVQLPDNFERDYVNQRQKYVKEWLKKERNKVQGRESFTPKSILKNKNKAEEHEQFAYGSEKLRCNSSSGLFFRRQNASFGTVSVGSLSRMKLELCNATENQVKVVIEDPKLPFVLLHNEINMQPRSYVRIPIRFVPVVKREFRAELIAKSDTDGLVAEIVITGSAM